MQNAEVLYLIKLIWTWTHWSGKLDLKSSRITSFKLKTINWSSINDFQYFSTSGVNDLLPWVNKFFENFINFDTVTIKDLVREFRLHYFARYFKIGNRMVEKILHICWFEKKLTILQVYFIFLILFIAFTCLSLHLMFLVSILETVHILPLFWQGYSYNVCKDGNLASKVWGTSPQILTLKQIVTYLFPELIVMNVMMSVRHVSYHQQLRSDCQYCCI